LGGPRLGAQQVFAITKKLAAAKRAVWNALLDLRYGRLLRGSVESQFANLGAVETANTPYDVLAAIFPPGVIGDDDVLVDIGCGKGRVINWWLHRGYRNKIVGIELDPTIADQTRRRLRRHNNVAIITGDAIEHFPSNGTVFYLYNPFNESTVRAFRDRILELTDGARETRIFYYRPVHGAIFERDSRWAVERRRVSANWSEEVAFIRLSRVVRVDDVSGPWRGSALHRR
jgi:SAM-dependent methyltransferase